MIEQKALRFNEGKNKWSLVYFKALEPMVQVLTFGMQKYTKTLDLNFENVVSICQQKKRVDCVINLRKLSQEECVNLAMIDHTKVEQSAPLAKRLDELNVKECVLPVMKHGESKILQILQTELENTKNNIDRNQTSELKNEKDKEKELKIQDIEKNKKDIIFSEDFHSMESPKIFTSQKVKEVAKYVEVKKGYTLIIVIQQDSIEEFFVVNAIKELDCYKIVLKILEKLSYISKIEIIDDKIISTGKDNWKKGLNREEILESMQRHLAALIDGEENDPESKISHIGHIFCNCMFYSYFYVLGNKPTTK